MTAVLRSPFRAPFRSPLRSPFGGNTIPESLVDLSGDTVTSSAGLVSAILNQGTGGAAYDLSTLIGTADNLRAHPSGSCLLYGASGDSVSTPDSIAIDTPNELIVRVKAKLNDWTPSSPEILMSKYESTGSEKSWLFRINSATGRPRFNVSNDGSSGTEVAYDADAAPAIPASGVIWIEVHFVGDNGAGDSDVTFRMSEDDTNNPDNVTGWAQIGSVINSGSTETIYHSDADLEVGARETSTTGNMNGCVLRGAVYDAEIDTKVADFNPLDYVSGETFVSGETGETWTLNGDTFIQNSGHSAVHSIGGVGLESPSAITIPSGFTLYTVIEFSGASPTTTNTVFDSKTSGTQRASIQSLNSLSNRFTIFQGNAFLTLSEPYDDDPHVFAGNFNGDATTRLTVSDVGELTGDAGPDNYQFGTLFANRVGGDTMAGSFLRMLIYNEQHSVSTTQAISSALAREYKI